MTYSILPWAVLLLVGLAAAIPAVTFPINSQVPPVARIGKPFSFEFSSSTFSPSSQLTYTLSNAPEWLSIDSKTRRIYGTPEEQDVAEGDVVGVPFELEASDGTGSASMDVTLVVCRHSAPAVQVALVDQGLDFAPLSQPSSFIMGPNEAFAFSLSLDTFSHPAGINLSYYAVMADNSPLPAWIAFEESTLSFSGTTPALEALIQTPQAFNFQLLASDVVGFSGASLPFSIVVGNHEITAGKTNIVLNATVGEPLSYTGLSSTIKYDGKTANSSGISFSTSGMPTWLTMDKKSWEISGTPTENADSSNFTITMQDQYSDTLNLTVSIQMTDGLFTGTLPQLNLTAGGRLDFDLTPYVSGAKDVKVWIETNPKSTWVFFDTSSKRIYGDVPQSRTNSSLVISVYAQSTTSGDSRIETMTATIRGVSTQNTATTSEEPTATSTPTPTSSSDPEADSGKKSNTRTILLAVLLPVLFVLSVAACLLVFCCRRRRQKRTSSINRRDISRPVPGSLKTDAAADSSAEVESLDTIYETDYSEHPSEVHLGRDPYGQLYSRPGFLTPPPSRDGKKHDSNGMRLVNPSWSVSAPDTPTPPPRARMQLSDDSLPGESRTGSRPTTSGRQRLEVEIPSFSMFNSNQQTPESAYFHNIKPNYATDTPRASSDRTTALEDFMQDYMYSPNSRPDSSDTSEAPRPPPLTASGHRQRPPFPRRLFADGLAQRGTSSLRGHDPASISPPDSENGDFPRSLLSQAWSSEDMDENASRRDDSQDEEQADEALMTAATWPTPPHIRQQREDAANAAHAAPPAAHIRLVSDASASEVDDWVGRATSQYSKASDWMEAVSNSGKGDADSYNTRGGSLDERRRRRSGNPGMSRPGTGRSSGDYPVFI